MTVREVSDPRAISAALYSITPPNMVNYFRDNLSAAYTALKDIGGSTLTAISSAFNTYNSDSAIAATKRAMHQVYSSITTTDVIYEVPWHDITTPNAVMRHYIMVDLLLNKLATADKIDGYRSVYIDPEAGTPHKFKQAYGEVYNGFYQNDGKVETIYFIPGSAKVLDITDTVAILRTQNKIKQLIAEGEDPTEM